MGWSHVCHQCEYGTFHSCSCASLEASCAVLCHDYKCPLPPPDDLVPASQLLVQNPASVPADGGRGLRHRREQPSHCPQVWLHRQGDHLVPSSGGSAPDLVGHTKSRLAEVCLLAIIGSCCPQLAARPVLLSGQ